MKLADQVAQKLHACTGPFSAGRARDVLDSIRTDTRGEPDYRETAEAARTVFRDRATHGFPPEAKFPAGWGLELETLAQDLGFSIRTAAQMQDRFRDILAALSGAAES